MTSPSFRGKGWGRQLGKSRYFLGRINK